jgi:hypothetical protein
MVRNMFVLLCDIFMTLNAAQRTFLSVTQGTTEPAKLLEMYVLVLSAVPSWGDSFRL